jgi:hypothetical protein
VARPHFLDLETTPVSDGVKRIVEYVNAHPKCTRRKLMEAIAPSPPPPPIPITPPPAKPDAPESASATTEAPLKPVEPEPTPEQTAVIGDLHWLIHQGHVIEFANGVMDTAKKPLPRPAKPEAKRAAAPAEAAPVAPEEVSAPVEVPESASGDTPTIAEPAVAEAALAESAPSVVEADSPIREEAPAAAESEA